MGTYRLILALLVLYSHAFGLIWGRNPGVVAVISFFVISGYVMTLLVRKAYPSVKDVPTFYLDRVARLYPQFIFYLCLTLVLIATVGIQSDFISDRRPVSIALNFAILPLGFYMFGLGNALYLPPTWSLGLEATFYLVFPFFFMARERVKLLVTAASVGVFLIAFFGLINTDWFGYRLLPGTFFLFAIGYWRATGNMKAVAASGALLAVLFGVAVTSTPLDISYNVEVTLGGMIGIIAIMIMPYLKRSKIDEFLGNLSYGVFLNHFILIFLTQRYGWPPTIIVPAGSLILAAVSFAIVERPALLWRHRLRPSLAKA